MARPRRRTAEPSLILPKTGSLLRLLLSTSASRARRTTYRRFEQTEGVVNPRRTVRSECLQAPRRRTPPIRHFHLIRPSRPPDPRYAQPLAEPAPSRAELHVRARRGPPRDLHARPQYFRGDLVR